MAEGASTVNDSTGPGGEGEASTVEPLPFDETIRFLRAMRPDGRCVLSAICPNDRGIETRTFDLARPDRLRAWLGKWNGKRNLYWMPNTVRATADPDGRPSEADIEDKVAAYVDIDPSETVDPADEEAWQADRARILKSLLGFRPTPSAIVDSGNGYQAFWLLDEPLYVGGTDEGIRQGKGYNVALAEKLGGDDCESLEHLYRLPGTINKPSDKKRAKGRTDRTATVVRWPGKKRCALGKLDWADPGEKVGKGGIEEIELGQIAFFDSLDDLPGGISDRIRKVIELGPAADAEKYPSRNEAVMAVCCAGVRAGWTNEEIAAVILDPKWRISERLRQRGGKRDAALEIAKARSLVGKVRPQIVYDEDELPRVLDETEAALRTGDIPIYQMDGRLVRAVRLGKASDDDGVKRAAGALVIREVGDYFLKERMIAAAQFVELRRDKQGEVVRAKKKLPLSFAKHYAERAGLWELPELVGISEAPTLRADGTIVLQEGYDPASGLIIDTQRVEFPPIPEHPTKEDAKAALKQLLDVIGEFPFEPDDPSHDPLDLEAPSASRSVALSMILTAVIRRSLRTAPMHGLSAPTMATGKSLLADVAAMIATGRPAPVISYSPKEEENEKRLFACLRQGDPLLAIDNIDVPVSGDALCSILTAEVWQSRVLGVSLNTTVSTKTLMIANGNNLSFRGDMATRVVVARLDARTDDPGERTFRYDLKELVPRERPRLVAAALTILRAFIVAGMPQEGVKPFARFEDWSRLVRGALIWLGQSDPVATRKKVATSDTVGAALAELHEVWQAAFGHDWKQPGNVIEAAADEDRRLGHPGPIGMALSAFYPNPRGVNAIGLGRQLSKYANRRIEGRWIELDPNSKTGNRYRLMTEQRQRETQMEAAQGSLLRGE